MSASRVTTRRSSRECVTPFGRADDGASSGVVCTRPRVRPPRRCPGLRTAHHAPPTAQNARTHKRALKTDGKKGHDMNVQYNNLSAYV